MTDDYETSEADETTWEILRTDEHNQIYKCQVCPTKIFVTTTTEVITKKQ